MKKNLFYLPNLHLLFVCIGGMFLSLTAQQNLTDDNLAVSGYDVVSYQQNEVAEGSPQFKVLHNKAVYLFKNEVNGVNSEPIHIYDPNVSIWNAYRDIFFQMKIIFDLSQKRLKEEYPTQSLFAFLKGTQQVLGKKMIH